MMSWHIEAAWHIHASVKHTIIASGKGLAPCRHQAIIWNNAGIFLIWPLGTNFSETLIEIHIFSFNEMHLKILSGKWQPFCLCLKMLILLGKMFVIDNVKLSYRNMLKIMYAQLKKNGITIWKANVHQQHHAMDWKKELHLWIVHWSCIWYGLLSCNTIYHLNP